MKVKKTVSVILALFILIGSLSVAAFSLSGNVSADVVEFSKKTAIDAEAEGVVLLKNEDSCLPLNGKKLNIFGIGSVYPFLGGAGSGAVASDDPTTFYEALDEAGIQYNNELKELYEANIGINEMPKTDNIVINNLLQIMFSVDSLNEMPVSKLTGKIMENARNFSDTAVLFISRTGSEGSDLSADTLRLNDTEKQLVEKVTSSFANVIVLFNIGNVMQMDWLEEYDSIKAAAVVWIPGEFGFSAVAEILSGEINPSGKLADTVSYRIEDHPSGECFGSSTYQGSSNHFVEYREGIYVGYRYFETFAPEKVQFPFGYGLSYTSFSKEITATSFDDDTISITFEVTNTGSVSGKETVQVYYSAPYRAGGIEKSAICLGGFDKTGLLAPGEKESLIVEFPTADMASYDRKNAEAWVLEAGDYRIIAANDVEDHIAEFIYTVDTDRIFKTDMSTGTEIRNLFEDSYNGFPILSRADKDGTYPVFEQIKENEAVRNSDKLPAPVTEGTAPVTGAKYDKTITLRDVYEDDSLWDAFLDQMTVDEMARLVSDGGYGTAGLERLDIPATMDNDGPSSIKGRNGLLHTDSGTAFPCETAIACTWNTDIAMLVGVAVGKEAADIGTDIWYAPGLNIHRNPGGGRNFEYYSEDPLLSGKTAAATVRGCSTENLVVTLKHFALNDQESNRNGIYTWADEQTMREIYLKAFEIAIKESGCSGIMSAYNRIGADWCGGKSALLIDLLRKEWGFRGFVVSDFTSNLTGTGYMSPVIGVYNGNDTFLTGIKFVFLPSHIAAVKIRYLRDPIGFGTALRERCRELCMAKMKTRAFLEADKTYDDSLSGALVAPAEWDFSFPYIFSAVRFILNNMTNILLFALRALFG